MGVFVNVVRVGLISALWAAWLSSSVIVWVGWPAGPVTVTAAVCSSAVLPILAVVMLPSFLTCSTKPSLFWVMTISLLSSRQSSNSNSSWAPSVCSPLSCLASETNNSKEAGPRAGVEGVTAKKNTITLLDIIFLL